MPSLGRFIGQSKQYPSITKLTDQLLSVFWIPNIISLSQDMVDWKKMNERQKNVLKRVHAFFVSMDGIVNENITENFLMRIQSSEHRTFYEVQIGNEAVHKLTYAKILAVLVDDPQELDLLFNSILSDPIIKKKAAWAMNYMGNDVPIADQLLAFVCVEGIQFCACFLIIFYFKELGVLPGVTSANEYISRDESIHLTYGTTTYADHLVYKSSCAGQIIRESVELECEFIRDVLGKEGLPGLQTEDVCEYIKMVADRICRDIGMEPMYNAKNKFPFMEMISLGSKSNNFERHKTDYIGRQAIESDSTKRVCVDLNF
jgi:ribonucleoside-diphosphate reductase subunit M2